jgi:circadian clock protein KaiC
MTQADTDAPGGDDSDLARVPSHVGGLDAVLNGGFLQGGLYMIQGPPGAGKTILASQVLYGRASAGERALFVTVLGENHGRMFAHLRPMRFFDASLVPDQVTYISAYHALGDEGLKGVATLLRREVHARGATLLVLDGVSAVEAKAGSKFEMQRFTHELQTLASMTGCTMFLLTTSDSDEAPERTMVDGLIELRQQGLGVRNERRIEALFAMPTRRDRPPVARVSTGVASLDAMFGGGIPAWTVTALVGPSGAGKTTLGLQFLSVSNAAEPGLLFGCDETPERLRLRAATMKLGVVEAEQRGDVELLWYPVGEHILDELGHRLLDAVRRRGVKRLVIDGVAGFQQAALEPERIVRFWSALSNELRALGVTTLHTSWIADLVANEFRVPASGVAPLAETIVLMRYVELRSQLHRLISLVKVRDSTFDPTIRAFTIGDAGIVVGELFEGAEAALSGRIRDVEISGIAVSSGVGRDPSGGGTGLPA